MARFVFPDDLPPGAGSLKSTGILVPVSITVPLPRKQFLERHGFTADASMSGYALIDTGAELSAVDDRVMQAIEVPALNQMETSTPHGLGYSNVYNASASLPQLGLFEVPLEGCLGCYLGEFAPEDLPIIMLLGRDILRHVVLRYDGPAGKAIVESRGWVAE